MSRLGECAAAPQQLEAEIFSQALNNPVVAFGSSKPKRGRKRTPDSINKRLTAIEQELAEATAIDELQLVQERRDLTAELSAMDSTVDIAALEKAFVGVAKAYGERKGISYASWREVGVSAGTLTSAGITRSS